ncbi:MAG: hypothetical protein GYA21_05805 [Myxococcales bacterium]|nr:hypothetical protein [Myxococcales bacterium]
MKAACSSRGPAWLLGTLLALTAAPPALPAEPLPLRYRFAAGAAESFWVSSSEELEMSSNIFPNASHRVRLRSRMALLRRITAVDAAGATIELSFPEAEGTLESDGRERPVPQLAALTAARLVLRQDERGEFAEARLLEPETLEPAARFLAQEFANSLSRPALVFPERALAPGDTWSVQREVPLSFPGGSDLRVEMDITFRLEELPAGGRAEARISAQARASLDERRGKEGSLLSAKIQAAGTGEFRFRPDTGRLVSSRTELSLSGELGTSDAGRDIVHRISMKLASETRAR